MGEGNERRDRRKSDLIERFKEESGVARRLCERIGDVRKQ